MEGDHHSPLSPAAATSSSSSSPEERVRSVISEQFSSEIACKEEELQLIEDRIRLAKMMLRRLRLGVLAQHFGLAGFYNPNLDYSDENIGVQGSWEAFEAQFLEPGSTQHGSVGEGTSLCSEGVRATSGDGGGAVSCGGSGAEGQEPFELSNGEGGAALSNGSSPQGEALVSMADDQPRHSVAGLGNHDLSPSAQSGSSRCEDTAVLGTHSSHVSRFYSKKRVIVGNTSQYLDVNSRSHGDSSTHKWMVYVRGPNEDADISHFVRAVRFFLHPSYHPNDIILISKPPFHLTRLGWGEFPIRTQLEFSDSRNKPIDIIHNLILDRTHTGQQTLGAETIVDLEITLTSSSKKISQSPGQPSSPAVPNGVVPSIAVNGHSVDAEMPVYNEGLVKKEPLNSSSPPPPPHANTAPSTDMQPLEDLHDKSSTDHLPAANTTTLNSGTTIDLSSPPLHPPAQRPLIIQHLSLPVSSPSDVTLLDHDYCSTVVVSHCHRTANKAPNLQQPIAHAMDSMDELNPVVLSTNLDRCLHTAVGSIPLYGGHSEGFYLSASTLAEFKAWPVGRRRACEWMRAVAVRKLLQKKLRISSLLTTKQVVDWCRKNGYTPLDPASQSGPGFCKYCGCELSSAPPREGRTVDSVSSQESFTGCHQRCWQVYEGPEKEDSRSDSDSSQEEETGGEEGRGGNTTASTLLERRLSTASLPFPLFSELVSQQAQLSAKEKNHLQEQTVDVDSVPCSSKASKKTDLVPRFRIPQTPELKWVQQTAGSLGVRIFPAVIDQMYAHVIEHMIFMACSRFLRAILTRAVREGGSGAEFELSRERILTPLHVYRAVQSVELCDFLTNQCLSLKEAGQEEGSGSSSDSSGEE